jgi:hypothetical protein
MLLTVAELPEYLRAAGKLLNELERRAIVDHLAQRPAAGDLIDGTGGVRRLRWRATAEASVVGAPHLLLPWRGDAAVSADDVRE